MRQQFAAVLCSVILGFVVPASPAVAQPKNANVCFGDWQFRDTGGQADRVTSEASTAQARALAVAAQPVAARCAPAAAGSRNAARDRQVFASIKDLMESIIDPSADVLWNAVGTVVDNEGVHESFPKTPEEWLDLRRAAIRIIEGANLLLMPGREAAPAGTKSEVPGVELEPAEIAALIKKKRKSFDGFAKALQALGVEALRASEAKSTELLMDAGGRMEDVCEGCHRTFWYPGEKHPAARNSNAGSAK
jgi:hypothetical protein